MVSLPVFTLMGHPSLPPPVMEVSHTSQNDTEPTQFEWAMGEPGIQLIFAGSPQTRERGERINQTFQD